MKFMVFQEKLFSIFKISTVDFILLIKLIINNKIKLKVECFNAKIFTKSGTYVFFVIKRDDIDQ